MATVKEERTVDDLTGVTSDTNGSEFGLFGHTSFIAFLDITKANGTTPTLDVKVQTKDPESGNWVDTGDSYTQQSSTGTNKLEVTGPVGSALRFVYTVGGTNPDFDLTHAVVPEREAPA